MTGKLNHKYLNNYLTFYYQYLPHMKNYPADKKQTIRDESLSTTAGGEKEAVSE